MKKILIIFTVFAMSLLMVSCAKVDNHKNQSQNSGALNSSGLASSENKQPQKTVLTVDELKSYVKVIELTTDNWQEYFEIKEIEEITPADFEDEEPEIEKDLYVTLKSDNICAVDTVMRFSYKEKLTQNQYDAITKKQTSNSEGIYTNSESTLKAEKLSGGASIGTLGKTGTCTYRKYTYEGKIYETLLDVKDIECLKVQGKILLVNIPNEAWNIGEYGANMPYLLYEKDGEKQPVLKDGLVYTLKEILGLGTIVD